MDEDNDGPAIQARPAAVKADGKYILKSPSSRWVTIGDISVG
jgi:hypothetical protein